MDGGEREKKHFKSDLTKVDARGVKQADYEEIPELDEEFFERADEHRAGVLVKRNRGRLEQRSDASAR